MKPEQAFNKESTSTEKVSSTKNEYVGEKINDGTVWEQLAES